MFFYTFIPKLLNMSITAGVVIVFVLLLRILLRKAPKAISYALWSVVLFRLLCPVTVAFEGSLFGLLETPTVERGTVMSNIEYIPTNIVHTQFPAIVLPVPGVGEAINETLPRGREQLVADPLEAPMAIATYLWMLGVVVMAGYGLFSYVKLKQKLITASRFRKNIYLADEIVSPFVLGIIMPKIYLPSSLQEQEQEYILLHEQYHIRRFDHVIKLLAFGALCIHWFNPLVWVAFVLAGKDMEMSCDEAVVKRLGEGVLADYTASLLSLTTGKRSIAGIPPTFGEGDARARIYNLAKWKKPSFLLLLSTALVCVVAVVCMMTNPPGKHASLVWLQSLAVEDVAELELVTIPQSKEKVYKLFEENEFAEVVSFLNQSDGRYVKTYEELAGGSIVFYLTMKDGSTHKVWNSGNVYLVIDGYYFEAPYEQLSAWDAYSEGEAPLPEGFWEQKEVQREVTGEAQDTELIQGTTYVPYQCLYMNPLSSYIAVGGDSGYKYIIGEDFFATISRQRGEIGSVISYPENDSISVKAWSWQEFPYTDEEWAAMYIPGGFGQVNIREQYEEILYQPLDDSQFMLRVDGALWLVEIKENPQMGRYLWSIYSLVPEAAMGSMLWDFAPMYSSKSPVLQFQFDMEEPVVTGVCEGGRLTEFAFDENRLGAPLSRKDVLCWSPVEDDKIAGNAIIHFSVQDGNEMPHHGNIYITATDVAEGHYYYEVRIVGTGLYLTSDADGARGIISIKSY